MIQRNTNLKMQVGDCMTKIIYHSKEDEDKALDVISHLEEFHFSMEDGILDCDASTLEALNNAGVKFWMLANYDSKFQANYF